MTSADRSDWLWTQQDTLTHRVRVSVAYHAKRERFFGVLERLSQALAAMAATSAFADIVGKGENAKWFALGAAVASLLPLVFGFAEQARKHGQLKSGFNTILSALYQAGVELDEAAITQFKAQVADLEAGEPAALGALVIQCENEIATAEKKRAYPLTLWERAWMHFYNFDPTAIISRPAK
jgi:RNAse (barnase) inhibitor barstar